MDGISFWYRDEVSILYRDLLRLCLWMMGNQCEDRQAIHSTAYTEATRAEKNCMMAFRPFQDPFRFGFQVVGVVVLS